MTKVVKPNVGRDIELICNNERFSWAYQREENPHTSGRHFVNFRMTTFITFFDFRQKCGITVEFSPYKQNLE